MARTTYGGEVIRIPEQGRIASMGALMMSHQQGCVELQPPAPLAGEEVTHEDLTPQPVKVVTSFSPAPALKLIPLVPVLPGVTEASSGGGGHVLFPQSMTIGKLKAGVFVLLALAACASPTPRNDRADVAYVTGKSVGETVPCIIHGLDSAFEGFRHSADVVVPEKQFEIRHHARTFNNQEVYFVRVKRTEDNGSDVQLFATSMVSKVAGAAVNRCR